MSVKRYSVWEDEMFEEKHAINSTNGMVHLMVKHEDYAALEHKLAESQREFRAADATSENLQMQLEKVAAELNEIKAAVIARMKLHEVIRNAGRPPHTDFWHQSIYMADKRVDDSLASTPNHDAFLAEVRAQGVEMAACALDGVNQFNYANMLDDLALKIRKGVQS